MRFLYFQKEGPYVPALLYLSTVNHRSEVTSMLTVSKTDKVKSDLTKGYADRFISMRVG